MSLSSLSSCSSSALASSLICESRLISMCGIWRTCRRGFSSSVVALRTGVGRRVGRLAICIGVGVDLGRAAMDDLRRPFRFGRDVGGPPTDDEPIGGGELGKGKAGEELY